MPQRSRDCWDHCEKSWKEKPGKVTALLAGCLGRYVHCTVRNCLENLIIYILEIWIVFVASRDESVRKKRLSQAYLPPYLVLLLNSALQLCNRAQRRRSYDANHF